MGTRITMATFTKNQSELINRERLDTKIYLASYKIWGNNNISRYNFSQQSMIYSIQTP